MRYKISIIRNPFVIVIYKLSTQPINLLRYLHFIHSKSMSNFTADEETPLLRPPTQKKQKQYHTPLPWRQFSIVMLLQVSEPLTVQVIAPFAPQVCWLFHFPFDFLLDPQRLSSSNTYDAAHKRHRCDERGRKPSRVLCWAFGAT